MRGTGVLICGRFRRSSRERRSGSLSKGARHRRSSSERLSLSLSKGERIESQQPIPGHGLQYSNIHARLATS
jgi:hypothetical protein